MSNSPKTWVPDRNQLKARNFLKARLNAGLFLPPGFGKSSITLSAIVHLIRRKRIQRVLIIAPIRPMYAVWPEEISIWEQFKGLTYRVIHGKKREEALRDRSVQIHITNYDGLSWIAQQRLPARPWDLIVLDESGNIKHPTSIRSKALRFLQTKKKIPYCWILNGSPVPRNYEDLFGQLLAMDNGKSFGKRIGSYRNKYFRRGGWANKQWTVTKAGKFQIKKKLTPIIFSLDENSYEDLPPLKVVNIEAQFTPQLKEKYLHFIKENIVKVCGEKITASNAGALTQKALQFTGGNLYLDELDENGKKIPLHIHDLKEKALLELLDELQGNQALIGYRYIHEKHRLQEILKRFDNPVPTMDDPKKTVVLQDAWNAGQYRVMIGNPKSMGHGLNLQRFKEGHGAIVFYTLPHDYDHYDQMIRRIRRRGFRRMVIVYRIMVKGTIDYAVASLLERKEVTQNDFMRHLAKYWEKFDGSDL